MEIGEALVWGFSDHTTLPPRFQRMYDALPENLRPNLDEYDDIYSKAGITWQTYEKYKADATQTPPTP